MAWIEVVSAAHSHLMSLSPLRGKVRMEGMRRRRIEAHCNMNRFAVPSSLTLPLDGGKEPSSFTPAARVALQS